jgi:hypothetical protein
VPRYEGQLDAEWAISELQIFLRLSELRRPPSRPGVTDLTGRMVTVRSSDEIVSQAQVVEQILHRVIPDWRTSVAMDQANRWIQHREAAQRAIAQLQRMEEVREKLGDSAPSLNASTLHPWVWEAARSLWQSGHYRQAVGQAAAKINAEAQNKAGSRKRSETDLFNIVFSADREPKADNPRFLLPGDDGGKTADSVRRGVRSFAEGCYAALRNPISHDPDVEVEEHEALEQLAAFSILARWIDSSTVRHA